MVTISDLVFILDQIKIAEYHVGPTFDPFNPCSNIIGPGPDQIPEGGNAEQLPFGLRTLNGVCNNLVPGQETFGATYQPFLRLMPAEYRDAEASTYDPTTPNPGGMVIDSQPRIISNLISDQTAGNPSANAAAGGPGFTTGPPLPPCIPTELAADQPACEPLAGESYYIENVAPDLGISRPFSTAFTYFGQFFDHGLDLTTKSGEPVFMPLQPDDPLILEGAVPPGLEFMVMSRAIEAGVPGFEPINQASPYVDQNQTYTSDPAQQVWQREYVNNPPVDTGRLLAGNPTVGDPGTGLTTWADIKAQALSVLGFELLDIDVLDVPMTAADLYGNFLPGPNGFPQMITKGPDGLSGTIDDVLVEGDLSAPVATPADVVRTGHGWLVDIAHHATPGNGKVPDSGLADTAPCTVGTPGSQLVGFCDDLDPTTYDNELLDAHFICGDGRCNENIALSSIHHVFHSEHNRILDQIKTTLAAEASPAFLAEWQLAPSEWDGKRLFQAAKFATEMQYQHLAFEEFARRVQPNVDVFSGYDTTIDAGIMGEFAHAVYRFGHTMLTEDITRRDTAAGTTHSLTLIEGFLNPPEFFEGPGGAAFAKTPEEAAGGILSGLASVNGQEIDEFVVEALRNNLLGLPLDLVSINLARGRDAGIPRLNSFRQHILDRTGSVLYEPYTSWLDYGFALSHPESLVNFIAAYGTDSTITSITSINSTTPNADRRAAATVLMGDPDFMRGTGPWDGVNTGVDDIDMWIGSLAEKEEFFGGLLGPTANYVFELQMENLQNGDRFYYLSRLAGIPMLTSLEGNSLSELIERNTTATQLATDVFMTPTYTFDLDIVHPDCVALVDDPSTSYDETSLLVLMPNCTVRFPVLEPAAFSGRTGTVAGVSADDMIIGGLDDDSIRGHGGNDRINAGEGNDVVVGGAGNDIIYGAQGLDNLKGGPGHDAISGGTGEDLIQGGDGNDFMLIGTDPGEVLGGPGNDIVIGGDSFDTIFGDEGDDWLVGGGQADLVQGDAGAPFQDNPVGTDGHDVLDGGLGNDDYDAEGGDDIMLAGQGTERFEGMFGFDWVTHKGDPFPADSDLLRLGLLPPAVDNIRDRFDFVEGLSGWMFDDVIRGDDLGLLPIGLPARPLGTDALDAAGIARIAGLADLLPAGATSFDSGNILLGGGGSDILEGRGQNDIIDGDAWLNVQLSAPDPTGPPGSMLLFDSPTELRADVFSGLISPGDITIVRTVEPGTPGTDVDVAEFDGPMSDYDITVLPTHVVVRHARGLGGGGGGGNCPDLTSRCNDGTDTLFNIEFLRFSDGDFNVSGIPTLPPPSVPTVTAPSAPLAAAATASNRSATVSWITPSSDGGDPNLSFTVTGSPAGSCTATAPILTCTALGLAGGVPHTFTVTATNSTGTGPASAPSAPVTPTAPTSQGPGPAVTPPVVPAPLATPPAPPVVLGATLVICDASLTDPFTDVPASSFATSDIACLFNLGVTTGTAPDAFSPRRDVTREQMASFVARLYRVITNNACTGGTTPFTDVPAGSFATDDIACIYNLGIASGTAPDAFSPRRDVTREQMAAFLARLYRVITNNACTGGTTPFTDVTGASFAANDIACIYSLGLTTGTAPDAFSPRHDVTREQMAAFLARLYRVITA